MKTPAGRKKKANKQQRAAQRAARADIYLVAFNHGYEMGYAQAMQNHTTGKENPSR